MVHTFGTALEYFAHQRLARSDWTMVLRMVEDYMATSFAASGLFRWELDFEVVVAVRMNLRMRIVGAHRSSWLHTVVFVVVQNSELSDLSTASPYVAFPILLLVVAGQGAVFWID